MALPPSARQEDFVLVLNFKYEITQDNKIKVHRVETVKLKLNQEVAEQINMPENVIKNVTKEDGMQTFELNAESKIVLPHLNNDLFNENPDDEGFIELEDQSEQNSGNGNGTTSVVTEQQSDIKLPQTNNSNTSTTNTITTTNTTNKVQQQQQLTSKRKIKGNRKKKKSNSRKNSPKKPRHSFDDDGAFSDSDHEEEFYYTEIEDDEGKAPSPPSPPTLSHRDMARPPHEDPEYQRQIVGNFRQGLLALSQNSTAKLSAAVPHHNVNNAGPINIPTSPLAHHNYTWHSPVSPVKHARWSPRPSTSSAPYPSPTYIHHYNNSNNSNGHLHHNNHHQQPQQQQGGLTIPPNAANMTTLSHSAPTPSNLAAMAATISPNLHHPQQQPQQQQHGAQHLPTPQQSSSQHHLQQSTVQATVATTTTTTTTNHRSPQSPNRRTRGDNKKCRKVYGMDHKDQWCTQCKWKKACSRFGD